MCGYLSGLDIGMLREVIYSGVASLVKAKITLPHVLVLLTQQRLPQLQNLGLKPLQQLSQSSHCSHHRANYSHISPFG